MMKPSQALLGALSLALCTLVAVPAQAQTRAALVQNIDEPGRSPFQQGVGCIRDSTFSVCHFKFAAVPAGKRLVLTNINGYVDTANGTPPNGFIVTSGSSPYSLVHFTGQRGATLSNGTRSNINQQVLAYLGPGETVEGYASVLAPGDYFSGGFLILSGYYITLP